MTHRIAFCSDMENPYYDAVLRGVKACLETEADAELMSWMDSCRFPVAALKYLKPDGLLLGPVSPEQIAGIPSALPAIGFSNVLEHKVFPAVVNDDVAVGRLAAESLIDAGYEHILLLSSTNHFHARQRTMGADEAAKRRHIPFRTFSLHVRKPAIGETYQEVSREMHKSFGEVLDNLPPNAGILSLNHGSAIEALAHLRDAGQRHMPGDCGIVLADLPTLDTTPFAFVELDAVAIGVRSAGLLLAQLRNPAAPPPALTLVRPRGVRPGSTLRR